MKNNNHNLHQIQGGLALKAKSKKKNTSKTSSTYSNVIQDFRETSKNLHSYQINDYFSSAFGVEYKKRPSNVGVDFDSTKQKGGAGMEDGYKKLIDRLDLDIRDHKQEIRDRDARLQSEMQEREERIHREAKEREERILNSITSLGTQLDNKINTLSSQINQIEQSVIRSEERIDSSVKHVQSMVSQNLWGRIATIVAIAGLTITIIISMMSMNDKSSNDETKVQNKTVETTQKP